jgi:spermidine synthase
MTLWIQNDSRRATIVYRKATPYHDIRVVDSGDCRALLSGTGRSQRQSAMRLDDLRRHELEYSTLVFSCLLFVPEPRRVLVVGLGGGVLPREMLHYFPETRVDVAEIDPEMAEVARRFFFLPDTPRLRIMIGDGRDTVQRILTDGQTRFDIVILDAFDSEYVPRHLMTAGFLEMVKRLRADDGVVVANMFSSHPLYPSQVRTYMEVFDHDISELRGCSATTSSVIFAPGPAAADRAKNPAGNLDIASRLRLPFALRIPQPIPPDRPEFVHAKPLTDP